MASAKEPTEPLVDHTGAQTNQATRSCHQEWDEQRPATRELPYKRAQANCVHQQAQNRQNVSKSHQQRKRLDKRCGRHLDPAF